MIENYCLCTCLISTKLQAKKKINKKKPRLHHLYFSDLEGEKK